MKYSELPDNLKVFIYGKVTEHEDGSISVDGEVNWWHRNLTSIPIKFRRVTGTFNCEFNRLTSLEGAPDFVGGDFACHRNRLTSLDGAPARVENTFNCSYNPLVSMKKSPSYIGGALLCINNKLTSLDGLGEVHGEIYCNSNPVPEEELIADYQRKRAKKDLALESLAVERILT